MAKKTPARSKVTGRFLKRGASSAKPKKSKRGRR